jgi:hypothetical protein
VKVFADFADFSEMVVDIVLGVAVTCHKASNLASKKDSVHALVLERESLEKGFPYLLSAQNMGRAVVSRVGQKRCSRRRTRTTEIQDGDIRCLQEDCVHFRAQPSMTLLLHRRWPGPSLRRTSLRRPCSQ